MAEKVSRDRGYRSDTIAISRDMGPLSLRVLVGILEVLNVYFLGDHVYIWRDDVYFCLGKFRRCA